MKAATVGFIIYDATLSIRWISFPRLRTARLEVFFAPKLALRRPWLCEPEESLRVEDKNVIHIRGADLRSFYLLQRRATLVACRVGVEQAAENQAARAHRLHEVPDITRPANVRGVKQDIRCSLRNIERELAVDIRRQGIHGHKRELREFQGQPFQSPYRFHVRLC